MNEFTQFGRNLHEMLSGILLPGSDSTRIPENISAPKSTSWARRIDKSRLPEIFAEAKFQPQPRAFPTSGVYHVLIKTTDKFSLPKMGQVIVDMEGYSQVVVSAPQNGKWGEDIIYVNYAEHKMFGSHPLTGNITVSLNPEILSGGNIFPSPTNTIIGERNMACRVNIAAQFEVEKLGATLYNKTPVQIASDKLERVPPLHEGGAAHVFSLPLYRLDDPDGELVGYIESLDYHVQGFAPRLVVESFRSSKTKHEFDESMIKNRALS